jgi:molybdate transport system substrate-binding protein
MIKRFLLLCAVCAMPAVVWAAPACAQPGSITIFAAASLKNAIDDINATFTKATGSRTVASYAASSALMKQIEQGAPADLFVSADLDWMDYGTHRKLIQNTTRVNLLGNRLVLIAPKDSGINNVSLGPGLDLSALAGRRRIVVGDIRSVPAGKYAKEALEKLGLWSSVEKKLAMTENVRAALTLVARGEAPLGIVYETDAKVEPNVKVIGVFPPDSHAPIIYPAALIANAKPEAAQYLAFLRSAAARVIFESYGFTFLPQPSS